MVYMKFSMPELPGYANIESASFNFWYTADAASGALNMKAYIVNFPWDESSLNWTTASHTNFGMDTSWWTGAGLTVSTSPKKFTMNITGAVKKWFGEDRIPNYGLAFKRVGGKITTATIMSSEAASTYRPYAVITYSLDLPVAEGTYYIRNGEFHNLFMTATSSQDDDDDTENATGVTSGDMFCEMFDPPHSSGITTKMWSFTYLNNGYYTIRSEYDNTYLSVRQNQENTGGNILVREPIFTGDARQQWKVTATLEGRYKIEPRSAESYTTNWVMASSIIGIETGFNVIQIADNGSADMTDEWYLQSTNLNPRMSFNVTIERDVLSEQDFTDAELLAEFQAASDAFLLMYGIKLNVTIQDIETISSIAVNSECDEIDNRNAICGDGCGLESECSTEHHKYGGNFFAVGLSHEERVCRVVGFALCGRPKGEHSNILGMTDGKNGNKEFVVSTRTVESEESLNENLAKTIQHELSHTFGTSDHDHISGSSTQCIMTGDFVLFRTSTRRRAYGRPKVSI